MLCWYLCFSARHKIDEDLLQLKSQIELLKGEYVASSEPEIVSEDELRPELGPPMVSSCKVDYLFGLCWQLLVKEYFFNIHIKACRRLILKMVLYF